MNRQRPTETMHRGIPQKCYAAMEKKPEINPESPHPHTNSSRISSTGAPEIKLGTATAMQSEYAKSTKKLSIARKNRENYVSSQGERQTLDTV